MKIDAEHDHGEHDHTAHNCAEHDHAEHSHEEHSHEEHTSLAHEGHDHTQGIDLHAGHNHALPHAHGESGDTWAAFIDNFMHLAIEFTALFLAMVILTSLILSYVPRKKIESLFSAPRGGGYFAALCLAMCTPLCNISGIPLFQGLLHARAKFGPCMTFLLASPLISPLIAALLYATFGLAFTLFYVLLTALFAVLTGAVFQFLHFERFINSAHTVETACSCCDDEKNSSDEHMHIKEHSRITPQQPTDHKRKLYNAVLDGLRNFKNAAPYLLLGIALSALVFSFAPEKFLTTYTHDDSFLALLVCTLIGLPLHVHLESLIPASTVLLQKGMGLGAVMAFLISAVGISITTVTLLKPLFKLPLLLSMTAVVFLYALLGGLLFPIFF